MNIHASPAEAALLITSSYQRREPRAESMADYDAAMDEFREFQRKAKVLRNYVDKYGNHLFPADEMEIEVRELRASAVECWRKARAIRSRIGGAR